MSALKARLRRHVGDPADLAAERQARRAAAAPVEAVEPVEPRPSAVIEKLRRLHRMRQRPPPEAPPRVTRPFRPADPDRPVTAPPEIELVEMRRADTACLLGKVHMPAGHRHGALPLESVLRVDGKGALLLSGDADLADFEPTEALFFDLETSGLLGGSGNLAFLSGVVEAHSDGSATVHQVMIRDPTEEPAALDYLAELLAGARYLVSFNGKSFDRNVLADRFTMNRMSPDRVLEMPHLDLLHPARRLFAGSMPSCSLGALEETRLGVFRHQAEVSGAEVPQRWFDFLRSGRFELLRPVLDHNALDLLSLLVLAAHLVQCVDAPGAALVEPSALVAASRLLLERGEVERAEELLKMLVRGADDDPVVYGALSVLAEHLRKTGRHAEALPLWRRMMRQAGAADLAPWRCAAIALERRLGRPEEALQIVDDLLDRIGESGPFAWAPEIDGFRRRRDRLTRRSVRVSRGRRADPAPGPRPDRGGSSARAHTVDSGG